MRSLVFQSAVALLIPAGAASAQGIECSPNLPPIYATPTTGDTIAQTNANFQALSRAVQCLQNALAASQRELGDAERKLTDLGRQLDQARYGPAPIERATVRACNSAGIDIVYVPAGVPCASIGPEYQDDRSRLPTYEVMVPR